jgi:hypothetical protein
MDCPICNEKWKTSDGIRIHLIEHHSAGDMADYILEQMKSLETKLIS